MEKQCFYCEYKSENKIKFAKHILHSHKLKIPDYLIKTKYNGIPPTCKCGCGEETKYMPTLGDFSTYIKKHLGSICKDKSFEEIWGDPKSEKRVKAISEGRKKKFQSGEYDYLLKNMKQPRSQETKDKIGNSNKGKLLGRARPEGFGIGRIHSQETKDKMSQTAKRKWETGDIGSKKHYTSKLEDTFQSFLDLYDVIYLRNFYIKEIKAFYDFYIPKHNTIIEVDGDFWHCNPNTKHSNPKYESQKKNLIRDKEKNKWALDNGFKIIRIWEYDIHNNIDKVKLILNSLK